MEVDAWVPTPSQVGRMRSFFLGGSPEVKDLTFAGVPPAATASLSSRYGFASESAGSVRVRVNTLAQGPKPASRTTGSAMVPAGVLQSQEFENQKT